MRMRDLELENRSEKTMRATRSASKTKFGRNNSRKLKKNVWQKRNGEKRKSLERECD